MHFVLLIINLIYYNMKIDLLKILAVQIKI